MIRTAVLTATLAAALVAGNGLATTSATPAGATPAPVLVSMVTPLPASGLSTQGAAIPRGRVLTGGIVDINHSGPTLDGFLQGLFAFLQGLFGGGGTGAGGTGNNGGG